MMKVKNNSTGKVYDCTPEQFDANFKGKENWTLIKDKAVQKIGNTITEPTRLTLEKKDTTKKDKPQKNKS